MMEVRWEELEVPLNLRGYFSSFNDKRNTATSIVKLPGGWKDSDWYWILYILTRHHMKHAEKGYTTPIDQAYVKTRVDPAQAEATFLLIRTLFKYGIDLIFDVVIDLFMAYFYRGVTPDLTRITKDYPGVEQQTKSKSAMARSQSRYYKMDICMRNLLSYYTHENATLSAKIYHYYTPRKGTSFAAGPRHALYVTENGVFGAGSSRVGELGMTITKSNIYPPIFVESKGIVFGVQCRGGSSGILTTSGLYMSGNNRFSQLGLHGNKDYYYAFERVQLDGILDFSLGTTHTLIRCRSGLYVVGSNEFGQLGTGDLIARTTPVLLPSLPGRIERMCTGGSYSIVETTEGIYAFGLNNVGQLGLGDFVNRSTPTRITLLDNLGITRISCGLQHTVFASERGEVYVCGSNTYGQLGLRGGYQLSSIANSYNEPVVLTGIPPAIHVACGDYTIACCPTQEDILIHGIFFVTGSTGLTSKVSTPDMTAREDTPGQIETALFVHLKMPSPLKELACSESTVFVACQDALYGVGSNASSKFTDAEPLMTSFVKSPLRIGYELIDLSDEKDGEQERPSKTRRVGMGHLCTMCDDEAMGLDPFHEVFHFCGTDCFARFLV